jgi:hypothetical protein
MSDKELVKAGYWWAKSKSNFSRIEVIKIKADRLDVCYPTDCQDYWCDTDDWILLRLIPEYKDD